MNSLLTLLQTICKGSSVASSAGVPLATWAAHHVQTSYEQEFASQVNLGRLPLVVIKETTGDYEQLAENGGMRDTTMILRIYCKSFRKRIAESVTKCNNIKTAILAGTFNTALQSINASVSAPILIDNSVYIDLTFTSETTYDNSDYLE